MIEGTIQLITECAVCNDTIEMGVGNYDSRYPMDLNQEEFMSELENQDETISHDNELYAMCQQCQRDALNGSKAREREVEARIEEQRKVLGVLNAELLKLQTESKDAIIKRILEAA